MSSTKISALSAATTLTGAETIPVVQGGVTKKVTTDQFLIKDASGNVGICTALKQADLDLSALLNGPFKALIGTTVAAALSRGTYTSGSASTGAGIHGWRSAFKHNGSQFDCVQLTAKATVACNIRVEVQRSNGTVVASGQVWCPTALTTLTVPLNRVVTDVAADEVCYIAYYRPDISALISYPAAGAYDGTDANPATYPEAYFSTAEAWQAVASPGNYRVHFRLMNLSGYSRSLSDEVAALQITVAPTEASVNYAVSSAETVTADSTNVAIAGSGFSSTSRALVFTGWGERYLPDGVSFNAVRMVTLSRTASADSEKWRTLHVFVRTGASSHNGGTVVAVGDIMVDPELSTLSNATVLLRDPVTKAVKTLTDADFSGGEYFIGVYAKNKDGGWAACGEPNGTMSNTQGNSYYCTSSYTDPSISAWAVNTSNTRQAFQHLLMTNPQEVSTYTPTPAFAAALAAAGADAAPEVVAPPTVFGLEGKECNLYFDNLFLADAGDYNINVDSAGSVGQQLDECWRWVPAGAVTSGDLALKVHGKRTGGELVSKTIKQRAAAASAGSGITKKVMVVGDSLVNAAVITQTLLDLAGPDVMDLALLGTRGTAPNLHEGRGGWRIEDYATAGRTYYKFTVSGVTVPPAINSSTYTNNGNTYTVEELSLVGGAGTMVCSVSPLNGAPTANGVLTRTYGSGDATIGFTAAEAVSGNPFWHSGAVSFATYLSSNNVTTPDWVLIALGINDVFGQTSDAAAASLADSSFNQLDTLIASIKAAEANIRVGLMPPTPPTADQNSFGNNYTTEQIRWRNKRNVLIWGRQLIAKYADREAERIYVVPSHVNLDTVHGYPYQTVAANARTTQTVIRQTNSVHPDTGGYQQIADAVWAFLKYYA